MLKSKPKKNPTRIVTRVFFSFLFFCGLLGVAGLQAGVWWMSASAPMASPFTKETDEESKPKAIYLEIASGTPGQQIGTKLINQGLIRSETAWKLWTRWQTFREPNGGFQAGAYEFYPTEDLNAIATKIWRGSVVQDGYTIREGWTLKKMADYLESLGFFSAKEFMAAASEIPTNEFPWLPKDIPHLEGFLYPDTYHLNSDQISPQAVIRQMLGQFERLVLPVYEAGKAQTNYSLKEWVTLASIVEREAVIAQERPLIAGVFARRLEEGIPLGADPTVEYGLGVTQTPDRPLTWEQVETPSPYNTYLNVGLPPTPIGSPGLPSLTASLNPQKTEYLYFVARYDGTHVFSRTLAEHQKAQEEIHDRRDGARQ